MLKKYFCEWCGNRFEQNVRYVESEIISGSNPPRHGHKQNCSDQVKCPKCCNFISTWETRIIEGKKIKIR
jgi:hypothetical protein